MDMNDVRRQRLKGWLEQEFDGRGSALCRYYSLPDSAPSYLSQLLSGHRVFGERAARKLEKQCSRPAGWLDIDPAQVDDVEVLKFDRERCAKLRPDDRELIESFIALVLERNDRLSVRRLNEVRARATSDKVKHALRRPIKQAYSEQNETPVRRSKAR